MRYPEAPPRTGEILRLVLPRIAQHGGSYDPAAYGVWYEHLAGINPALSQALESQLQQSATIDPAIIQQLHARHIQQRDDRATEKLQEELTELIQKLAALAASSTDDAAAYARALATGEQGLGSVSDAGGLQSVIQSLVRSTTAARTAADKLSADLAASQTEVVSMRQQLGTLQGEALTDPLTGLRNRRGFERDVAQLIAERGQVLTGSSFLLADIDHFKRVNDTYGHLFGDQVLRACAQVLHGAIKGRDVLSRFGGEEFLILLPDTPGDGALALAEQIRTAFSKVRIRRTGREESIEPVTISLGVATLADGEALEQVIERADKALYQAKNSGRNCVRKAPAAVAPAPAVSARVAAR
jgi:diguanylate cyclase